MVERVWICRQEVMEEKTKKFIILPFLYMSQVLLITQLLFHTRTYIVHLVPMINQFKSPMIFFIHCLYRLQLSIMCVKAFPELQPIFFYTPQTFSLPTLSVWSCLKLPHECLKEKGFIDPLLQNLLHFWEFCKFHKFCRVAPSIFQNKLRDILNGKNQKIGPPQIPMPKNP